MVTLSIGIMIRSDYVFFKDPAMFLIIGFFVVMAMIIKFLLMFVTNNYFHIWKVSNRK